MGFKGSEVRREMSRWKLPYLIIRVQKFYVKSSVKSSVEPQCGSSSFDSASHRVTLAGLRKTDSSWRIENQLAGQEETCKSRIKELGIGDSVGVQFWTCAETKRLCLVAEFGH
jgi:hypothetical protein